MYLKNLFLFISLIISTCMTAAALDLTKNPKNYSFKDVVNQLALINNIDLSKIPQFEDKWEEIKKFYNPWRHETTSYPEMNRVEEGITPYFWIIKAKDDAKQGPSERAFTFDSPKYYTYGLYFALLQEFFFYLFKQYKKDGSFDVAQGKKLLQYLNESVNILHIAKEEKADFAAILHDTLLKFLTDNLKGNVPGASNIRRYDAADIEKQVSQFFQAYIKDKKTNWLTFVKVFPYSFVDEDLRNYMVEQWFAQDAEKHYPGEMEAIVEKYWYPTFSLKPNLVTKLGFAKPAPKPAPKPTPTPTPTPSPPKQPKPQVSQQALNEIGNLLSTLNVNLQGLLNKLP